MTHIDRSTGRNRREAGRLHARARAAHEAYQSGEKLPPYAGIRRQNGKPAEKRVTWRRRNRLYPVGKRRR
jgi:hypothetical protein